MEAINIFRGGVVEREATGPKPMQQIIPITGFPNTFPGKAYKPREVKEFAPPGSDDGGGDSRSRRIRKLLEIAIQVAKEKNVDELGMIHAMNMIAGDDFFNTAVEGILPDITDKEYMFVLQSAYKTVKQGLAEGKVINTYLWHGSRQKIPMLEPRQSVDTGGAAGSNQNAIYATSDPKVAIAMGLTTAGSDTGMFPNDPQMVLFSGKIRKGEYVYLHKLPFNGPDGKPQFVQGGNSREFHSIPGVEGIKPIDIKEIPVNKYLNLIRKATPTDLKLRKKYMKKQGVAEGLGIPYPTTYEQENNKFKRRGPMRITAMTEFATPGSDDREPDEEEILRQLAAQWWNGSAQQMKKAQQTLQAMGWDIGQDESGDDDAGVFVIRIGDEHGDSYIAFPHSELGLNEDYLNEK